MRLMINQKTYEIIHEIGTHRDGKYTSILGIVKNDISWPLFRSIQKMEVALCQLDGLDQWWIIPAYGNDDALLSDVGPFVELEDAIMNFYLRTDPSNEA